MFGIHITSPIRNSLASYVHGQHQPNRSMFALRLPAIPPCWPKSHWSFLQKPRFVANNFSRSPIHHAPFHPTLFPYQTRNTFGSSTRPISWRRPETSSLQTRITPLSPASFHPPCRYSNAMKNPLTRLALSSFRASAQRRHFSLSKPKPFLDRFRNGIVGHTKPNNFHIRVVKPPLWGRL